MRLTIDVPRCLRELDEIRTARRMFEHWLAGRARELEYEALFGPNGFSTHVGQLFAEVYGIAPIQPLFTIYWKVTPPLREIVTNRDEVLSALGGTDFEAMAEEALS
jgi:hypothetical protein